MLTGIGVVARDEFVLSAFSRRMLSASKLFPAIAVCKFAAGRYVLGEEGGDITMLIVDRV